MSSLKLLGSLIDIIPAIVPLDLQTQRDGDYVSLKNAQRVGILIFKGAGTDGDDPTFTFQQAQDVAGTGVKNLAVVTEYYEKEGTLTAVGTWTRVTQAASHQIAPGDPSAQSQAMYYTEIAADELDVDNGFDCLRVTCSDVGNNAQLGAAIYILGGLRYPARPDRLPNAIAD
jgi:hypothetical protein